ncbi:hypothetical protein IU459_22345 [Nocardia amamiensis]|uniref:Uncharacterized protein n=1 Tax=Nocardia amamiensis TaxID=404578 RepID=A0ABS0CUH6_9NOCA|nr:hypothetical protein [Nocardia amamiensis]MBF6300264.1 hypothetical protein [Nocardia amamiensis]
MTVGDLWWVGNNRAWLDSLVPAFVGDPDADAGQADRGGRVHNFHGMTPASAARMLERIDARRAVTAEFQAARATNSAVAQTIPEPVAPPSAVPAAPVVPPVVKPVRYDTGLTAPGPTNNQPSPQKPSTSAQEPKDPTTTGAKGLDSTDPLTRQLLGLAEPVEQKPAAEGSLPHLLSIIEENQPQPAPPATSLEPYNPKTPGIVTSGAPERTLTGYNPSEDTYEQITIPAQPDNLSQASSPYPASKTRVDLGNGTTGYAVLNSAGELLYLADANGTPLPDQSNAGQAFLEKDPLENTASFGAGVGRSVIDAVDGAAAMVNIGSDEFDEAWSGVGSLFGIGPDDGPGVADSWKELGKGFLAWDDWASGDWAYALGKSGTNALTLGLGGSGVGKLGRRAGEKAGKGARTEFGIDFNDLPESSPNKTPTKETPADKSDTPDGRTPEPRSPHTNPTDIQQPPPGTTHNPPDEFAAPTQDAPAVGPGPVLSIPQRLEILYNRLGELPEPSSADEALSQLNSTLVHIEDEFSGVPANPNPGLKPDGRMYPPREDFLERNPDGGIIATTRGNIIEIDPDGSMRILNRKTGDVVYSRKGRER